jgi:ribosome maturation factor RimP
LVVDLCCGTGAASQVGLVPTFFWPKDFGRVVDQAMQQSLGIAERVQQAVAPVLEHLGFELVLVEYIAKTHLLRLYIDKPADAVPAGISLEDCTLVSRQVSHLLDAEGTTEAAEPATTSMHAEVTTANVSAASPADALAAEPTDGFLADALAAEPADGFSADTLAAAPADGFSAGALVAEPADVASALSAAAAAPATATAPSTRSAAAAAALQQAAARAKAESAAALQGITGHYTLEVSSPGLDRPLVTPAHFVRFVGHTVMVSLGKQASAAAAAQENVGEAAQRKWTGNLLRADDVGICLMTELGEQALTYGQIGRARLVPQF